ncbi:MAG TPA: MurR/RpiR family transcriptional regulator [Clostridia bacterium]|nr:MurR/RpiR family transcriptional regulator [Clostridia bacterium]
MTLMDRIHTNYADMTKSQRKIVHFMQLNRQDMLFDSLAAFSGKVECSEATVVRFARQLGYSGYADMQDAMHGELLAQANRATSDARARKGESHFAPLVDGAAQRIKAMYDELDMTEFEAVCRAVMEAENVLLVGYMDSFGTAAHALHLLDDIRPNVDFARLLLETNEVYRRIHKKTAMLVVSFAPHYTYTHTLLDLALQRGSTTLLITDSKLNSLARMASHVICAKPYFDSETKCMDVSAPVHLIYAMIRKMTLDYQEQVDNYRKSSLRRFEEYVE